MPRRGFVVAALAALLSKASSLPEESLPPRRRALYFGSMNALQRTSPSLLASTSRRRRVIDDDEYSVMDVARRRKRQEEVEDSDNDGDTSRGNNKLWPPWPFNLLTQRGSNNGKNVPDDGYRSSGSLFWAYLGQRLLITKRHFQHGELRCLWCVRDANKAWHHPSSKPPYTYE